jgi:predicted acylesterase/phospholipase RssA/CRP-like cAMP-binding protein
MAVLRTSHVFGVLEPIILNDLAEALEIESVEGGNLILREGDVAESMLIVISGRLRVSRKNPDGSLRLYNEVSPGETVGEAGIILEQRRFADVTALRDSTIAVLHRGRFEELLMRHPVALNRVFAQAVYHQLRHTPQRAEHRRAHAFVVVPLYSDISALTVADGLTLALAGYGRAFRVDAKSNEEYQLDELEAEFDFLIYQADLQDSEWTRRAFRQADQVIYVAAVGDSPDLCEIEPRLAAEPGFSMKRQHFALLHSANAKSPGDLASWREGRQIERVYPLRDGRPEDFSRFARFLTGQAVGLVLGGGGARGFAHLGVLRALAESHIPVDVIGGNSMGALIGAQYACGLGLDEIREQTMRFALGGERPTLPVISLLSGRRLERDLRQMFGDQRIEQLWSPFFAAACNLSQACTTVQESGLLWRAVLASNSPAGLLPPVLRDGDLLVDGAILDNVPVGAMRSRLGTPFEQRRGNGKIIAIDVDVREELGVDPALARLSVRKTIRSYFSASAESSPGIGNILYRAGHIGGLHQRGRTMAMADHYLEPPVAGFPLMGYRRATEIAEVGYRYAMEEIGRWSNPESPL